MVGVENQSDLLPRKTASSQPSGRMSFAYQFMMSDGQCNVAMLDDKALDPSIDTNTDRRSPYMDTNTCMRAVTPRLVGTYPV